MTTTALHLWSVRAIQIQVFGQRVVQIALGAESSADLAVFRQQSFTLQMQSWK